MNEILENKIYKHFKGDYYIVLYIAKDSETQTDTVVYRQLYEDCKVFTRSLEMFSSEVDKIKYPEVVQKYRFELQAIKSVKNI